MKDKLFDDYIQQKLYNKESSVPTGLWEKIIEQKEQNKPVFFWWRNSRNLILLSSSIFFLMGGIYTLNQYSSKNNKTNIVALAKNNSSTNINKPTPVYTNTTKETSSNKVEETPFQENIKVENTKNINLTQTSTKQNNAYINQENYKLSNKQLNQNLANYTHPSISKKQLKNISSDYIVEHSPLQPYSLAPKKTTINLLQQLIHSSINTNNSSTKTTEEILFFTKSGKALIPVSNTPPILNIRKLFGLDDCPSANGQYDNNVYIEGYSSIDYTIKRIHNISVSEAYLAKKDSAENMNGGFTVGVRISKSLNNNLMIKSGLQFSQMYEKFSLTTENERRLTTTITTRTLIRTGLPDTTISDTSSLIQIGYRTQKNTNLYRSLEIPILLSYQFGNSSNSLNFAITAGAIVNLSTWSRGNTVDELNQIVSINSKQTTNSFYNHQIGLSAYLSASVIKQLNNNWAVFAEPYARYSLGKNNIAAGFVQQFDAIGINFGTRFKIK